MIQHEADRTAREARFDAIWSMFSGRLGRVIGEKSYTIYDENFQPARIGFSLFGAEPYLNNSKEEYEYPSIILDFFEKRVTYRDRNGEIVIDNVRSLREDGQWARIVGERNIDGQNVACIFSVCRLGRTDANILQQPTTPLVDAA